MKFHPLLYEKYNNFDELEKKIEEINIAKEKGDIFEQFIFIYLNLKKNLYQIKDNNVYMEKDIPDEIRKKLDLEPSDYGVDGVFITVDEKIAAYQVKFRSGRNKPSWEELAKFLSEAEHAHYRYTIANCYELPVALKKKESHLPILVENFDHLDSEFFDEMVEFALTLNVSKKNRFIPYEYQKQIISKVVNDFKNVDRGKLIAACGTGKTLIALWITEEMQSEEILFIAPSLALIKQTIEQWSGQANSMFSFLSVCSDKTVIRDIEDFSDYSVDEVNFPVTTDSDIIYEFLKKSKKFYKRIIFSTYQSMDVLSKALAKLNDFSFDIIIFDEAHRTAGSKGSILFNMALKDKFIKSKKRLFMTATKRLVKPWIKKKAEELDRIVLSMDDEEYGKDFVNYNIGKAIDDDVISDYKIIISCISEKENYQWIRENRLLSSMQTETEEYFISAQNLFKQLILIKAMKNLNISKVITYHSFVKNAKNFIKSEDDSVLDIVKTFSIIWPELNQKDMFFNHVNGSMTAGKRGSILKKYEAFKYGVVSNARCLIEGVDIPIIDCVYFVDPKKSLIDIVQASGRALRKVKNSTKKIAYFIIPILVPEGNTEADIINNTDFETVHNVIQALRDRDTRLEEWINQLNLRISQGKSGKNKGGEEFSPIILDLPKNISIDKFSETLHLKIAEVNGDPTSFTYKTKNYGKKERKSYKKRIFKTLGDYSVESYNKNLVLPTITKFKDENSVILAQDLKINHNNISHTYRLGLMKKEKNRRYSLSPLGKQLWRKEIDFNLIFKRQMLRYLSTAKEDNEERILYPYRTALKIMHEVNSINFMEFSYGLYPIADSSQDSINVAVQSIKWIRENYPNIEILNQENKIRVLGEMNEYFNLNYTETDIWAKKTTINNQFIYFRNHLSLFTEIFAIDKKKQVISVKERGKSKILRLLLKDNNIENISIPIKEKEKIFQEEFIKYY